MEDHSTSQAISPLRELLTLAAPTVAQMASYTLMQFIDTIFLARAGAATHSVIAPTAGATAGIFAFAFIALGMGVLFVINTLVSQSFGRGDQPACGRYLWQGIWFGLGFSVLLVPMIFVAPKVFLAVGHAANLAAAEGIYLRIILAGAGLKLVATAIEQFFLGVNRPRAVAIATIAAVGVNIVAAWVLVLGHLGVSPHGVAGSAWAQNIGCSVEMLTMIAFLCGRHVRLQYGVRHWKPRWAEMKTLLVVGIPAGVQVIADVLAWSAFTIWVMAGFHTDAMAANVFVFRYMSVSFMPAFGIGAAVTALVGRYIGRGEPEVAVARAHLGFVVTAIYMVGCGAVLLTFRRELIGLFTTQPDVLATGATLLIFAAVYQLFDAMYIIYNGALRGAADTFVPAVATGLLCWGITVFGGFSIAHWLPRFGPAGPWCAALFYGVALGVFMRARFGRGKWKSIDLSPDAIESSTVSAPLV